MSLYNFIKTIHPEKGVSLAYDERPEWFRNWEKTGLLKFEDKNGDGKILYVADKEKNEMVKVDRDHYGACQPEIAGLPDWVIALVAAGGIAAACLLPLVCCWPSPRHLHDLCRACYEGHQ